MSLPPKSFVVFDRTGAGDNKKEKRNEKDNFMLLV